MNHQGPISFTGRGPRIRNRGEPAAAKGKAVCEHPFGNALDPANKSGPGALRITRFQPQLEPDEPDRRMIRRRLPAA